MPFGASCEMDICKSRYFRLNVIQFACTFSLFKFVLHQFRRLVGGDETAKSHLFGPDKIECQSPPT